FNQAVGCVDGITVSTACRCSLGISGCGGMSLWGIVTSGSKNSYCGDYKKCFFHCVSNFQLGCKSTTIHHNSVETLNKRFLKRLLYKDKFLIFSPYFLEAGKR